MKNGAIYRQIELGGDPLAFNAFVRSTAALGLPAVTALALATRHLFSKQQSRIAGFSGTLTYL